MNLADWNARIAERTPGPRESRATPPAEFRDPSAATRNVRYQTPGNPMMAEWDADAAIRWGYLANSVVHACVQTIAKAVAACPLRAGTNLADRTTANPNSRLAQLLGPPPGSPNPQTTSRRLLAYSVASYIVTGRYAWEVELDGNGTPVRLWPLVTGRLRPIPTTSGMDYWAGFKYGPPAKSITLKPEQVFYAWRPSLTDYREPESVLQAARLDITTAVLSDRYQAGFLKNNAQPATLVAYDEFAEDADEDAFQRQFLSSHRGPDNSGKTMFVSKSGAAAAGAGSQGGHAVEVTQLGMSQRDAQFLAIYQSKIEGICIALGVPMSLLNAAGRTFSNAGLENQNFYEATVLPLLSEISDEINMQLAPRLGPEVCWFDTDHVMALRPPTKFQQVSPVDLLAAGIVTKPEIRDEIGLPTQMPVDPEGVAADDTEAAQQAKTTIDRVALAAQTLIAAGFDPAEVLTAVGLPPMDHTDSSSPSVPVAPTAGALPFPMRDARHPDPDPEVRRAKLWHAADSQVRALEQTWERALKRLFARQQRSTLARLNGKRGRQMLTRMEARDDVAAIPPPDDIFDPTTWAEDTAQTVADLYASVVATGGARVAQHFGMSFDLEAPWVQEFIQERANQLAGDVTDTTYGQIKDALSAGVTAGEGIDPIAGRIRDVFSQADGLRARTIARTEVISSYNGSTTLVGDQLPEDVVAGQEWIATRDSRTRPDHADADGQVVGRGESFSVGGDQLRYPGDPDGDPSEVINCRCTTALLTPDEMQSRARARLDVRDAEKVLRLVAEVVAA